MKAYNIVPLVVSALLPAIGCAHGSGAGGVVVHQRAFLAADGAGVRAATLLDTGEDPPALEIERIDACGSAVVERLPAGEAAAVAAAVRDGAAIEAALPSRLGAAAPAWRVAFVAGPPFDGHRVRTVPVEDRRGDHQAIVLFDPAGRVVELARVHPDARVRVAPVPGGNPARAMARIEGPGGTIDLRILDLAAGARAIAVARGEEALERGDAAAALRAADEAAAHGAGSCAASGAPAWLRARALAASGAAAEAILDALARAIEVDPGLYRMYARTSEALAFLRGDPRFDALVAPRPLR